MRHLRLVLAGWVTAGALAITSTSVAAPGRDDVKDAPPNAAAAKGAVAPRAKAASPKAPPKESKGSAPREAPAPSAPGKDAKDAKDKGAKGAAAPAAAGPDFDEVLRSLKQGNADFVSGHAHHPHQDGARIHDTTKGQHPAATVLSCSDSRVPVELLFDQGIGDVFSVRVAGNVADTDEMGTVEYGVDHLGTPLLVVLGHTACGAVTAVVTGATVHGHIPDLVGNIQPALERAKAKNPTLDPKDLVAPAIVENVYQSMADIIEQSDLVRARLETGRVHIFGALYHLDDGTVQWLGEHPQQKELLAKAAAAPKAEHGGGHEPEGAPGAAGHGTPKGASHEGAAGEHAKAADGEPHEGAEGEAAQQAPMPVPPLAFAITAALACLAGGISVKLVSRGG